VVHKITLDKKEGFKEINFKSIREEFVDLLSDMNFQGRLCI
jgi:hypothetical protein